MNKIMLHRTSANIDEYFLNAIISISKEFSFSEEKIFKDLILLTIKNAGCRQEKERLTEYQNHSPLEWKKLNYSLNTNEIEIYCNARIKYKISISKLAFIGFLFFWELLILSYKERLKLHLVISFSSYTKYKEKFFTYRVYYINRLQIKQTE